MNQSPSKHTIAAALPHFKSLYLPGILLFSLLASPLYAKVNKAALSMQQSAKDSLDVRRDEYFKDIQIIIDDKPNGVFIDKPYKELTQKEKQHYLSYIPKKEKANGIQLSDYESFTRDTDADYHLDNKKVKREEILKHKREYFAGGGSKRAGAYEQYYFYTYPYFNKNIKPVNDHYPDKTYKITILKEAVDYVPDSPEVISTYKRNGDTSADRTAEVSYMSFGYTDEINKRAKEIMAHFPGGNDRFNDYLFSNMQIDETLKQTEIPVTFIINTNGSLSDIDVQTTNDILAAEVQRVMLASPAWIPAQRNGGPYQLGTRIFFKNNAK